MAFNTTGWFIGTLLLPALLFAFPASALTQDFDAYREDYGNALQAIDRGSWTEYQQMRPGLEEYPLAIYLDYFQFDIGSCCSSYIDHSSCLDCYHNSYC